MKRLHLSIYLGTQSAAVLCVDTQIKVAIEEKKLSSHPQQQYSEYDHYASIHQQLPYKSIQYCLNAIQITWSDLTQITMIMDSESHETHTQHLLFAHDDRIRVIQNSPLIQVYQAYYHFALTDTLILVLDHSLHSFTDHHIPKTSHYNLYHARNNTFHLIHQSSLNQHLAQLQSIMSVYKALAYKATQAFQIQLDDRQLVSWFTELAAFGQEQPHLKPWFNQGNEALKMEVSSYDLWLEVTCIEQYLQLLKQQAMSDVNSPLQLEQTIWADLAYKVHLEIKELLITVLRNAIQQTGCHHVCLVSELNESHSIITSLKNDDLIDHLMVSPISLSLQTALGGLYYQELQQDLITPHEMITNSDIHWGAQYSTPHYQQSIATFAGILDSEQLDLPTLVQRCTQQIIQGNIVAYYTSNVSMATHVDLHRLLISDPIQQYAMEKLAHACSYHGLLTRVTFLCPVEYCADLFTDMVEISDGYVIARPHKSLQNDLRHILQADQSIQLLKLDDDEHPLLYQVCCHVSQNDHRPPLLMVHSLQLDSTQIIDRPSEALHWMIGSQASHMVFDNYWVTSRNQQTVDVDSLQFKYSQRHTLSKKRLKLPNFVDKMEQLDQIIFNPQISQYEWPHKQIELLSSKIAAYRHLSRLFAKKERFISFNSLHTSSCTISLNPWGQSQWVDHRFSWPARLYDWPHTLALLTTLSPKSLLETSLQAYLQYPHYETQSLIQWARAELELFGLSAHDDWKESEAVYNSIELKSSPLFAALADSTFSVRAPLKKLWKLLRTVGYTETRIAAYQNHAVPQPLGEDPAADLIRLFILNQPLSHERALKLFKADFAQELHHLSAIKLGSLCRSNIYIDCVDQVYLASDHPAYSPVLDEESVCNPLSRLKKGFMYLTSGVYAGRTLDVSDTLGGIAIQQARHDQEVAVVAPNERSLRFSNFNLQLNGVDQYQMMQSQQLNQLHSRRFEKVFTHHTEVLRTLASYIDQKAYIYSSFNHLPSSFEELLRELQWNASMLCLPLTQQKVSLPYTYQHPSHWKAHAGYGVFRLDHTSHDNTVALLEHAQSPKYHKFYTPLHSCPTEKMGPYLQHYFECEKIFNHQTKLNTHQCQLHHQLSLQKLQSKDHKEYCIKHLQWPSIASVNLSKEQFYRYQKMLSQSSIDTFNLDDHPLMYLGMLRPYFGV